MESLGGFVELIARVVGEKKTGNEKKGGGVGDEIRLKRTCLMSLKSGLRFKN